MSPSKLSACPLSFPWKTIQQQNMPCLIISYCEMLFLLILMFFNQQVSCHANYLPHDFCLYFAPPCISIPPVSQRKSHNNCSWSREREATGNVYNSYLAWYANISQHPTLSTFFSCSPFTLVAHVPQFSISNYQQYLRATVLLILGSLLMPVMSCVTQSSRHSTVNVGPPSSSHPHSVSRNSLSTHSNYSSRTLECNQLIYWVSQLWW